MASSALSHYKNKIEHFRKATARAREKAGEMTESVLSIAETAGTAFAVGYFAGGIDKTQDEINKAAGKGSAFELFGVPYPLLLGIGAHAFALMGVGRGMESHLKNVGTGALSAHLFTIGYNMKVKYPGEGKTAVNKIIAGDVDMLGAASREGAGVTEQDLAALARL